MVFSSSLERYILKRIFIRNEPSPKREKPLVFRLFRGTKAFMKTIVYKNANKKHPCPIRVKGAIRTVPP